MTSETLITGALSCAVLSASLAYWFAGAYWAELHRLRMNVGNNEFAISGAYGEVFLAFFLLLTLYAVDRFAEHFGTASLLGKGGWASWALLAGLFTAILIRGLIVAMTDKGLRNSGVSRVSFVTAYAIYSVYSTVMFSAAVILVIGLWTEFHADMTVFMRASSDILNAMKGLNELPAEDIVGRIDIANARIHMTLNEFEDQLAPVFMAASAAFLLNFLLIVTPLKDLFRRDAIYVSVALNVFAIATIAATVVWSFAAGYSTLLEGALADMNAVMAEMQSAYWEVVARYADIIQNIDDRRSLISYIAGLGDEWGGLAAGSGVLQLSAGFAKKA